MSLYIGNKKEVANIGTNSFVKQNLAREWIGGMINSSNLTENDKNALTYLKPYAFCNDRNESSITLFNCTYVDTYAFMNSYFTTIDLPNCSDVNSYAFSGAYDTSSFILPKLSYVSNYCFSNCNNLLEINLPSITWINNYGFSYCENLRKIICPKVEGIGQYSFRGCAQLEEINTENVLYFYRYCFYGCLKLEQLDLSSAIDVSYQSFYNCTGLKRVWVPSTIDYLRCNGSNSPFQNVNPNCVIYTDIEDENHIPSNWSSYWNNYSNSGKLNVLYGATHQNFIDGTLPTFPYTFTVNAPQDCIVKITYLNIEQTTNTITMNENGVATYSVEKTGYLPYSGTVTMGTSDVTITVTSDMLVEIPSSIDINYDNATTGDNVSILRTLIDDYNFELNSSDLSIVNGSKTNFINNTVESHGYIVVSPKQNSILTVTSRISSEINWDYGGVYVDTKVYEPSFNEVRQGYNYGTGTYLMRVSGINMTPVTYTMSLLKDTTYYLNFFYVKDGGSVGNDKVYFDSIVVEKEPEIDIFEQVISGQIVSIDNSDITNLPSYTLSACNNLTSVNLPNLITLENSAISQCSSLTLLNIPNVKTIGYYGLEVDTLLTVLDLPNVETIYSSGLERCTSLRKVWISDKCTSLWPNVFRYDTNLTVYTNLSEAPNGWLEGWDNLDNNGAKVNIIWGATHEQFENA